MSTETTDDEGDAMATILETLFGKSADSPPVEAPDLEARVAAIEQKLAALLPVSPQEAAIVRTELATIREAREREEMEAATAEYFGPPRQLDPLAGLHGRQISNPAPTREEKFFSYPAH